MVLAMLFFFLTSSKGFVKVSRCFLKRPLCFRRLFMVSSMWFFWAFPAVLLKSVFVFVNVLGANNFHDRHGFVDAVLLTFSKGFVKVSRCFLKRPLCVFVSFSIASAMLFFLAFPAVLLKCFLGFLKRPLWLRGLFLRVPARNFQDRDGFVDVMFLNLSWIMSCLARRSPTLVLARPWAA